MHDSEKRMKEIREDIINCSVFDIKKLHELTLQMQEEKYNELFEEVDVMIKDAAIAGRFEVIVPCGLPIDCQTLAWYYGDAGYSCKYSWNSNRSQYELTISWISPKERK